MLEGLWVEWHSKQKWGKRFLYLVTLIFLSLLLVHFVARSSSVLFFIFRVNLGVFSCLSRLSLSLSGYEVLKWSSHCFLLCSTLIFSYSTVFLPFVTKASNKTISSCHSRLPSVPSAQSVENQYMLLRRWSQQETSGTRLALLVDSVKRNWTQRIVLNIKERFFASNAMVGSMDLKDMDSEEELDAFLWTQELIWAVERISNLFVKTSQLIIALSSDGEATVCSTKQSSSINESRLTNEWMNQVLLFKCHVLYPPTTTSQTYPNFAESSLLLYLWFWHEHLVHVLQIFYSETCCSISWNIFECSLIIRCIEWF